MTTQGTGAMDREGESGKNEYYESTKSKMQGTATGFASPWNRTSQFGKIRQTEMKTVGTTTPKVPSLDMAVVGNKRDPETPKQVEGKAVKNLAESLQRSQLIKPTTLNFPLNLPI